MEKIKVDASLFGIKQPIAVKPTVRVTYKLNQFMKQALEASLVTDDTPIDDNDAQGKFVEAIDQETEFINGAIKFIAQLLHIDEDRIWDNATEEEIGAYLSYLRSRMSGISEKEAQEALKATDESPKSVAEKSAKESGNSNKK
ncbi:phage tail tube assembly chaperone [Limosilactobacillus allomucosae]|uniref:phage tail tube assembly chaperone n=1 Tax=Limosilactobacillus allomucosae TaxID=3142938 RepID=UPI00326658E1